MSEVRRRKRWKFVLLIFLAMLALSGGTAFSQRAALQTWYYAYRLERAPEAERQTWADKLVEMGEPAGPRLLACLRKDDTHLCSIARGALEKLLADWGPKDSRSATIVDRFFEAQPSFSPSGQIVALQILPDLLVVGGVEAESKARVVVATALKDKNPILRVKAVTVAMRADLNLLPAVVPLLSDAEPEVRRAAMTALGPIKEGEGGPDQAIVKSDDLLHWLHDADPEVRQICELSLRSRHINARDIYLGKMLTDPKPLERLKLLVELPSDEEIDLGIWLQRLSNDPDSAVRAGAARVAAERRIDFADRLDQMIRTDPDATVRKIAEHYRRKYP